MSNAGFHAPKRQLCGGFWRCPPMLIILSLSLLALTAHGLGHNLVFIHSDNVSYYLPYAQYNFHSLFFEGTLPLYNPYQHLGVGLAEQNQTGLFYPLRYLGQFIAYCIGAPGEIGFAIEIGIYLLAAGCGMGLLLMVLGCSTWVVVSFSVLYACSGFLVNEGPNAIYSPPYVVALPYLFLILHKYNAAHVEGNKRGHLLLKYIALKIMLLTVGYTNYYVYIGFAEALYVLLLRGIKCAFRFVLFNIYILMLGAFCFFPMVVGALGSGRTGGVAGRLTNSVLPESLLASLFRLPSDCPGPYYLWDPNFRVCHTTWPNTLFCISMLIILIILWYIANRKKSVISDTFRKLPGRASGMLYLGSLIAAVGSSAIYFWSPLVSPQGIVAAIILHMGLYCSYTKYRDSKDEVEQRLIWTYVFLMFLFLVLSTGGASVITLVIAPVVLLFRWPFKWMLLGQFFAAIVSAGIMQRVTRFPSRARLRLPLVILSIFISLYCMVNQENFDDSFDIRQNIHHHRIAKALAEARAQGLVQRVVAVSEKVDRSLAYDLLGGALPTLYRIPALGGYDPLLPKARRAAIGLNHYSVFRDVAQLEQKSDLMDAYGVDTILVPEGELAQELLRNKRYKAGSVVSLGKARNIAFVRNIKASPLAFWEDNPQEGLNLSLSPNGFSIAWDSESKKGDRLVVAMWASHNLIVDNEADNVKIGKDRYNRIVIDLPEGLTDIKLRYVSSALSWGLIVSGISLVILLVGCVTEIDKSHLNSLMRRQRSG